MKWGKFRLKRSLSSVVLGIAAIFIMKRQKGLSLSEFTDTWRTVRYTICIEWNEEYKLKWRSLLKSFMIFLGSSCSSFPSASVFYGLFFSILPGISFSLACFILFRFFLYIPITNQIHILTYTSTPPIALPRMRSLFKKEIWRFSAGVNFIVLPKKFKYFRWSWAELYCIGLD